MVDPAPVVNELRVCLQATVEIDHQLTFAATISTRLSFTEFQQSRVLSGLGKLFRERERKRAQ